MEAARPNPLLTSKTTTKLAAWDVRTMYEAGKAAQVVAEMNSYKVSLFGLRDTGVKQDK